MHEAEIAAQEQMINAIREADHFVASLFVGRGKYEKMSGKTVKEAIAAGNRRAAEIQTSRRAILYAVSADNRATMITNSLIERLAMLYRR